MQIRRSLVFSVAENLVGLPLQVIGTMVMSRLLTPEEAGVFAVAAIFAALASTFRDFGVGEYLIQAAELGERQLRAALTMNIIVSWGVGLLLFIGAPWAAEFYRHPGVGEVIRMQSLSFLVIPFGAVTMAWFRREMNFKPMFIAALISNVTTFSVAIIAALAGASYMSLAYSSVVGSFITAGVAIAMRPKGFPRWPGWQGIGEVFHFGKFASGVYIAGQLGRSAPEAVIGRAAGMAEVAMFSRGGGLVELFNRLLLRSVSSVCLPYFAHDQRQTGSLKAGYLRSVAYLTGVGWPALAALGFCAYPAVRVLYGAQWMDAVGLARILCAVACIELIHTMAKEALMAVGEPKRASTLQILMQAARVAGLMAVIPWGLSGAAWGLMPAAVVGLVLSQAALRKSIDLHTHEMLGAMRDSALLLLCVAAPLLLLALAVPATESNYLRLAAANSVLAAASWLLGLRWIGHPLWAEVQKLAQRAMARFGHGGKAA